MHTICIEHQNMNAHIRLLGVVWLVLSTALTFNYHLTLIAT